MVREGCVVVRQWRCGGEGRVGWLGGRAGVYGAPARVLRNTQGRRRLVGVDLLKLWAR